MGEIVLFCVGEVGQISRVGHSKVHIRFTGNIFPILDFIILMFETTIYFCGSFSDLQQKVSGDRIATADHGRSEMKW